MPLVDLPLDDLYKYQGRNPRPPDFDEYWDAGLAEMHALGTDCELKPSAFTTPVADCFDLTFTGVGGAEVYAKFLRPRHLGGPAPAVLQFHGYTHHSADWSDKLNFIAAGFCVAALDCRGQGGRSQDIATVRGPTHNGHIIRGLDDSPEKMYYRQTFLDTAQLARIVMAMREVDEYQVGALGGSQGGGLTLACAALEPRIRKIAPSIPFLCDYQRVWEMDLATGAYAELKTFFRFWDPRHERQEAIFERLGYIDVQHLAPRIKAEVLMGTGLADSITPPSTQFAAFNKITAKKNVVIYPDFGHEGLPGFSDMAFTFLTS